jgi:signal transduction histidine kinase
VSDDDAFARLVSLACHDLRTPLATVHGFATTLARGGLEPPGDRYVEMIEAASAQLAELIDELSLASRIESGRYEPTLREADTLELAQAAAARLGEDRVQVSGSGAAIETDGTPSSAGSRRCSSRRSVTAGSTASRWRWTAPTSGSRGSRRRLPLWFWARTCATWAPRSPRGSWRD